tara:strand:- start:7398 stop:8558 length:1161 start_codon:yes stop_codon:yes gene_type:complete
MTEDSKAVEKTYEEFVVENHKCSLNSLKYKSGELIFEGVSFNSGLLSFDNELINCSIGTNQLKTFSVSDKKSNISYTDVKKFKFIDCKFSDDTFFKKNLESLIFEECVFEKRCYINNQYETNTALIEINRIVIKKTVFKENFKLHNTVIGYFHIEDTDFIKNADFFKSVFESGKDNNINFVAINFHALALFGNTEFKQLLQFKYVTFKGYSHFRSALFKQGFDLEYANIEQEMNFFDIRGLDRKDSKKTTSQETYRIIKHQLQKVGNIIGANKYHSLELSKRRQQLSFYSFDYLVLLFHWVSSNHSQSWLLPLIWIFIVGSLTSWGVANSCSECCFYQIEHIFKYISIFNLDDCLKKLPIIFVMNKVSLGYLYYQFLTAIRKDTRK